MFLSKPSSEFHFLNNPLTDIIHTTHLTSNQELCLNHRPILQQRNLQSLDRHLLKIRNIKTQKDSLRKPTNIEGILIYTAWATPNKSQTYT